MHDDGHDLTNLNIVIVTHGLCLRLFLMRWFHYTVREFEDSENPRNATLVVMERQCNDKDEEWYTLADEARLALNFGPSPAPFPRQCTAHSCYHGPLRMQGRMQVKSFISTASEPN